jgi:YHS domain-containing protein
MKTLSTLIAVAFAASLGFASADPSNDKCPVSGKPVDKAQTSKNVVAIGVCCEKCEAKVKADPKKYADAVAAATGKAVNTKCPYTGKAVDSAKTFRHEGQVIAVCCDKCAAKAKADPAGAAAKVTVDAAGNDKCPVSGKAIDPEKIVKIEEEVGFCCEKCKAKYDKDPAATMKKKSA